MGLFVTSAMMTVLRPAKENSAEFIRFNSKVVPNVKKAREICHYCRKRQYKFRLNESIPLLYLHFLDNFG